MHGQQNVKTYISLYARTNRCYYETNEVLEPITFVLAYPTILEKDLNILIYYVLIVLL